jgi:hypothetical protein
MKFLIVGLSLAGRRHLRNLELQDETDIPLTRQIVVTGKGI